MSEIETAIRLIVIGQEILIAAVFLFGIGNRAARFSGALLMLSIVGYLFTSDAALREAVPPLMPLTALLAIAVPYSLWLFARAVFEAPWPRLPFVYACALVVFGVWVAHLLGDAVSAQATSALSIATRVVSLLVVAHAIWLTLNGRPDDLIEGRRTFRLFFVVIVSIQIAAVLVVELALGGAAAPAWLDLTNVIIIAALTIGLAIPMLRLNTEFFEDRPGTGSSVAAEDVSALSPADGVLRDKLLNLMGNGFYRETGLTIPLLAEKLAYPEHQLRRLINGRLGHRNFSAFLNSYRVSEAKRQLADPEKARTPVLTIALDLGYASLGPFNRAFKAETAMTPTEFRRQHLGGPIADSE